MNAVMENDKGASAKTLTMVIYALYGAGVIIGLSSVVAIIVNYVKRGDVAGTPCESHFTWQIRTFWFSLLFGIIGAILSAVVVGVPILILTWLWYVYRIVKGFLYLNDGKQLDAKAWF